MNAICPNCGTTFEVKKNRAGTGASYASKITCLGARRSMVLKVMQDSKASLTSRESWLKERDECVRLSLPVPPRSGTTGRLSELVGLRLVREIGSSVGVENQGEQDYRQKGGPPKYTLTSSGMSAPAEPGWNPQR